VVTGTGTLSLGSHAVVTGTATLALGSHAVVTGTATLALLVSVYFMYIVNEGRCVSIYDH
jgi:hypothetical protein